MALKNEDSGVTNQLGTVAPTRAAGQPFFTGNGTINPSNFDKPAAPKPAPRLDPDSKTALS